MTTPASRPAPLPAGAQYSLAYGEQRARIVQVGAAIHEYRVGTRDVLLRFGEQETSFGYSGAVLLPWPNRIAHGRYDFDGISHQAPINEPEHDAALHGFSAWLPWDLIEHKSDRVVLALSLRPVPGYPFFLDAVVEYRLDGDGLAVRTTVSNPGRAACPVALGFHPYAAAAPSSTADECTLQLDAEKHLLLDEQLIPVASEAVDEGSHDFRTARPLAGVVLDDAFTGALPDEGGRSWARLSGSDGRTVAVWADEAFGYWQVYTGDRLRPPRTRRAVALEPMTAAPNAFRSGDGLLRLEPGESASGRWGVVLS
jgi:aldose 1-epimerase